MDRRGIEAVLWRWDGHTGLDEAARIVLLTPSGGMLDSASIAMATVWFADSPCSSLAVFVAVPPQGDAVFTLLRRPAVGAPWSCSTLRAAQFNQSMEDFSCFQHHCMLLSSPGRSCPACLLVDTGDRVWLRHAKAGEMCERLAEVARVDADGTARVVPTYRGEGRVFG